MSIATLFTIAKTWKQPTCPSTDEWIKKMCYLYYSIIKTNEMMHSIPMWMNLEITKRSKQDKYHMLSLMSGI